MVQVDKATDVPSDLAVAPINLGPPPPKKPTVPTVFNNINMGGVDISLPSGAAMGEVHSATKYLRRDRQPTASKLLCSNGAPVRNAATAEIVSGQQKQRLEPLVFHPHNHMSIKAPFDETLKSLQNASKQANSLGSLGWAMDFLFHVSHRRVKPETSLIFQMTRLIQLVTSADLPPACSYLLISSGDTALHKTDKATQAETAATGGKDKIRTINSGSTFLKQGLKMLHAHDSFTRVKRELEVTQYGLGFKGCLLYTSDAADE